MSATSEKKITIHAQMTIQEILDLFPHKAQKLAYEITAAGLHCVGCQAAVYETLEAGMKGHGMGDEAIARLVKRLNALLEEESDPSTITITPRAAKKFLDILEEEKQQGYGLRLGLKMSGCSGFEYILDFSEKALESDEVFFSNGIEIHVAKALVSQLLGCEIDYIEGLNSAGFKITNPNVRHTCGCGSSHSY
jgi:iron-sulfur cluster assembly accessory protein